MRICLLTLFSLASLQAGQIIGLLPVTGGATGGLNSLSNGPANTDNVLGASSNVAFSLNLNAIAPISHDFTAVPTGGVTEYLVTVTVTNGLTVPLVGWMFQLPGSPYDFDFPDFDSAKTSSVGWTPTIHLGNLLLFQGGSLAPGGTMQFSFNVDVPDPGPGTSGGFTSIPFAAVPEPSTWAMGLAGAALLVRRRRKVA